MSDNERTSEIHDNMERFVSVYADLLSHDMAEEAILSSMEKHFFPKPAMLFSSDEEKSTLQRSIDNFTRRFDHNDHRLVILPHDADPETGKIKIKTYHLSLVNEWVSYFYKCRRSVCRAHMYYITYAALDEHPEFWPDMPEELRGPSKDLMERRFWDAMEIATTRLASYWDRVGQIFDFVYFNIRQYERDGFLGVLERIKKNFATTYADISNSPAWDAINKYANSESRNGYKWLVRRRNLVVHSLQMGYSQTSDIDPIFEREFDHYDHRIVRDLAVKQHKEELLNIHSHLALAASLVPFIIEVAILGLDAVEREITLRRR